MRDAADLSREEIDRIREHTDSQQWGIISNWLSPNDQAAQQNEYARIHQKNTGNWLFETSQYREWLAREGATIFCPGIPGSGKSILTSYVVKTLWQSTYTNRDVGVAFMYCNYQERHEYNLETMLSMILKRFTHGSPITQDVVKKLFKEKTLKIQNRPTIEELVDCLVRVIKRFKRAFLVIDALDELESVSRNGSLDLVFQLQSTTGVNILATSRDVLEIEDRFTTCS